MGLTGTPLVIMLAALATLGPLLLVLTWRYGRHHRHQLVAGLIRFIGIALCQLVAICLVGVLANNSLGLYNSWSDLAGGTGQLQESVVANGLVAGNGSQGSVVAISVAPSGGLVAGSHRRLPVLVWLPPQYRQPAFRHTRFPVVMMLPGQPGTPEGIFRKFRFAAAASRAIDTHTVKPFVAVFPPLMIAPPRDTECTNVPGGPQADTWLAGDVRKAVTKRFRVVDGVQKWSAMGFSTGGFCAAKMLLRHRDQFSAAVGIGAYYDSETDHTTGDLFGHNPQLKNENSPIWLIQHPAGQQTNLLIVVSKQDRDSYRGVFYADAATMISQTAGTPGVATILIPAGGHNYQTYLPSMPKILAWLGGTAGL